MMPWAISTLTLTLTLTHDTSRITRHHATIWLRSGRLTFSVGLRAAFRTPDDREADKVTLPGFVFGFSLLGRPSGHA